MCGFYFDISRERLSIGLRVEVGSEEGDVVGVAHQSRLSRSKGKKRKMGQTLKK